MRRARPPVWPAEPRTAPPSAHGRLCARASSRSIAAGELVRDRVPATAHDPPAATPGRRASPACHGGSSRSSSDRDCVHRDGADDAAAAHRRRDLGPGQVAPETVRVAHGQIPIHVSRSATKRRRTRSTRPARSSSRLGDLARPREHRLEPVVRGFLAERRDAVERDAAPGRVEARLGQPQRPGAVRHVARRGAAYGAVASRNRSTCSRANRGRCRRWRDASSPDDFARGRAAPRRPTAPCPCRA